MSYTNTSADPIRTPLREIAPGETVGLSAQEITFPPVRKAIGDGRLAPAS